VLTVHEDYLGLAVQTVLVIICVIYEAGLVSQAGCINGPFAIEIE
jgi:hypothetical protein